MFSMFIFLLESIIFYVFSQFCIFKMNLSGRDENIYEDQNYIVGSSFFNGLHFSTSNYRKIENSNKYLAFHAVR